MGLACAIPKSIYLRNSLPHRFAVYIFQDIARLGQPAQFLDNSHSSPAFDAAFTHPSQALDAESCFPQQLTHFFDAGMRSQAVARL